MHFTPIQLFFWAGGLTLHILLATTLWARHRAHSFPCFTALIWTNISAGLTLYAVGTWGTARSYLVAYFFFAIIDVLLLLAVTWELAAHIFRPAGTWAPEIRGGFIVLVALSFAIALALAAMPVPPERHVLKAILDRCNVFSSALLCELFVLIMVVSVIAHLPWKTHVAAIAKSLGVYSFITLIVAAGHTVTGMNQNSAVSECLTYFRMVSYLVLVVYWTVALWQDAPATEPLTNELRQQLFTLQNRLEYDLRKLRVLKR